MKMSKKVEEQEKEILVDPEFGYLDMRTYEFDTFKELKRFIKLVETMVRRSPEYKIWVEFIKDTKGQNYCYFTQEIGEEVTIDIHHHPFTLFDLITVIINNKLDKEPDKGIVSYEIAQELMSLHYRDLVGYIPLVRTLHEKFHNGYLDIPINLVEGKWEKILEIYEIPNDLMEKVERYRSIVSEETDLYNWSKGHYNMSVQDQLTI